MVVGMILGTDMKRHVSLYSAFKSKVEVQHMAISKPKTTMSRRISDPRDLPEPGIPPPPFPRTTAHSHLPSLPRPPSQGPSLPSTHR